jgi:tetratricopeptide (TPR) repeat protein
MNRFFLLSLIVLLFSAEPLFAEECAVSDYNALVAKGKTGDDAREWGKSVEAYSRILAECRTAVKDTELVKVYDALSVAQLMQENFSEAIENAKQCIGLDSKYNACMMTIAKCYERLGDSSMALEYARSAIYAGSYDEYSSAVVIEAKDFIRRIENK